MALAFAWLGAECQDRNGPLSTVELRPLYFWRAEESVPNGALLGGEWDWVYRYSGFGAAFVLGVVISGPMAAVRFEMRPLQDSANCGLPFRFARGAGLQLLGFWTRCRRELPAVKDRNRDPKSGELLACVTWDVV